MMFADDQYIATVISEKVVTKVTVQLMHSMGGIVVALCAIAGLPGGNVMS